MKSDKNRIRLTTPGAALRSAIIPLCIMFSASSSGAESAEKHCVTLKPNSYFAVTSFINTSSAKKITVYIDDEAKKPLTGSGMGYFAGSATFNSGKGKVCISVETNGKFNTLSTIDDPLKGKPLSYVIGAEDGNDNDFNDAITYITPLEGDAGGVGAGGNNCGGECRPWGIGKFVVGECVKWKNASGQEETYKCIENIDIHAENWTPLNTSRYWQKVK